MVLKAPLLAVVYDCGDCEEMQDYLGGGGGLSAAYQDTHIYFYFIIFFWVGGWGASWLFIKLPY